MRTGACSNAPVRIVLKNSSHKPWVRERQVFGTGDLNRGKTVVEQAASLRITRIRTECSL
jgi:hypothetical protein